MGLRERAWEVLKPLSVLGIYFCFRKPPLTTPPIHSPSRWTCFNLTQVLGFIEKRYATWGYHCHHSFWLLPPREQWLLSALIFSHEGTEWARRVISTIRVMLMFGSVTNDPRWRTTHPSSPPFLLGLIPYHFPSFLYVMGYHLSCY